MGVAAGCVDELGGDFVERTAPTPRRLLSAAWPVHRRRGDVHRHNDFGIRSTDGVGASGRSSRSHLGPRRCSRSRACPPRGAWPLGLSAPGLGRSTSGMARTGARAPQQPHPRRPASMRSPARQSTSAWPLASRSRRPSLRPGTGPPGPSPRSPRPTTWPLQTFSRSRARVRASVSQLVGTATAVALRAASS